MTRRAESNPLGAPLAPDRPKNRRASDESLFGDAKRCVRKKSLLTFKTELSLSEPRLDCICATALGSRKGTMLLMGESV